MLPADQRLHPDHPSGPEVDLGLIDQKEMVVFNRVPQLSEKGEAARAVFVHLPGVKGDPFLFSLATYMAMSAC